MKNPLLNLGAIAATLLAPCLTLLSATAAAAPTPAENTAAFFKKLDAGEPLTVVVYGTSLTAGGAWAGEMKQWFDAKSPGKIRFVNSGGPGQNSDWGLKNLQAKVVDLKPDLVFIEFSYNDAHDKFKMPVERGAANLGEIVTTILAGKPETCVVLQTMNANWDANDKGSSLHRPQLLEFNENYRRLAKERGLPLLDHYPVWDKLKAEDRKTFEKYVPDGTHPTREGSLAVTWPTIKAWLDKKGMP